jgi:hypothetical protein
LNKIQNGGHCHGNQGAKNVKFTPNFTKFCSNVSCHIHIYWNEISQKNRNGRINFAAVAMEIQKGGSFKKF